MFVFCHRNYQTFLSVDYFGFNLGNLFRFYTKHNIIGLNYFVSFFLYLFLF